jgi:hypothetical protein
MPRNLTKKFFSAGPGGINCDCCRPPHCNKRDSKKLASRIARRTLKADLRKEITDATL